MTKDFIRIFNDRLTGRCDDPCLLDYIDVIDKLIWKVYNYRYKGVWKPPKRRKPGEEQTFTVERGSYVFSDGSLRVDPETFSNHCWEQMEERGLLEIVCDRNFDGDEELRRFLYVSFNNTLQEMIAELTPGLSTRTKQISVILNEFCHKKKIAGRLCWVSNEIKESDSTPAGLDMLMAVLDPTLIPQPIYPSDTNAKRGPSVSKRKMQVFLHKLIHAAGGVVYSSDLIELIKKTFGLAPMQHSAPRYSNNDGDREPSWEDFASRLRSVRETFDLGQDHALMAVELFAQLDYRMKDVYYYRRILGLKIVDTAKRLDCSTGSITNTGKAIDRLFFDYFYVSGGVDGKVQVDPGCSSPDEIEGVKALVGQLIIREKEHE